MLSKNMTFPAVFRVEGRDSTSLTKVVITGALAKGLFVGYTTAHSIPTEAPEVTQHPGIWGVTGDCKYTCVHEGPENRRIKFGPQPAQVQYEKLTIDQRAIVAALANSAGTSLTVNYIMETLKVDVNLAGNILNYADKKGYK